MAHSLDVLLFLSGIKSVFPYPVLIVVDLFLTCIQVSQEASHTVWYSHLFQNFPQFIVIHTVKGFGIVNKADIYFSGTLLLFRWSSGYWQFDLWFLCLFENQLEHLEVHVSFIIETWLGGFWALLCEHVRWVQLCSSLNILLDCLS